MIPIKDENPTSRLPIVTLGIVGLNIVLFMIYNMQMNERQLVVFFQQAGFVAFPATHYPSIPAYMKMFTSMFLHFDLLHLGGNLLYLWIFGNNVEDRLGPVRFAVFYLLCGVIASLSQMAMVPDSTRPMIGASGAIAGVLGAYLVLFPHARVLVLLPIFLFAWIPASFMLIFWFLLQVINGYALHAMFREMGGVAWFAHIGGFLAGMVLIPLFLISTPKPRKKRNRINDSFS
jgi:membrane associated rhomboid family serine protease